METETEAQKTSHSEGNSQQSAVSVEGSKSVRINLPAILEYMNIRNKYPDLKGHRKELKKELENLARKYPGAVFPGSQFIKPETSEYDIKVRVHAESLYELIETKLNKKYPTINFPKTCIRVLLKFGKLEPRTGKDLLSQTGLSQATLSRVVSVLKSLGFIGNGVKGRYHFYYISKIGWEFLYGEEKEQD